MGYALSLNRPEECTVECAHARQASTRGGCSGLQHPSPDAPCSGRMTSRNSWRKSMQTRRIVKRRYASYLTLPTVYSTPCMLCRAHAGVDGGGAHAVKGKDKDAVAHGLHVC